MKALKSSLVWEVTRERERLGIVGEKRIIQDITIFLVSAVLVIVLPGYYLYGYFRAMNRDQVLIFIHRQITTKEAKKTDSYVYQKFRQNQDFVCNSLSTLRCKSKVSADETKSLSSFGWHFTDIMTPIYIISDSYTKIFCWLNIFQVSL